MRRAFVLAAAAAALFGGATGCTEGRGLDRWSAYIVPDEVTLGGDRAQEELERLIYDYERNRSAIDKREIFFTQERLRRLGEEHANDRIGELAHLYVAKIYFQVEGYHDCIRTCDDFLKDYPRSEWRSAVECLRRECEDEVARYRSWRENLSTQTMGDTGSE